MDPVFWFLPPPGFHYCPSVESFRWWQCSIKDTPPTPRKTNKQTKSWDLGLRLYQCYHSWDNSLKQWKHAYTKNGVMCNKNMSAVGLLTIKDSFRRGRSILNLDIGSKSLCCCAWGCCCPPEVCCWGAGIFCCICAAILTGIYKSRSFILGHTI